MDLLAGPHDRLRVAYQEINGLKLAIEAACRVQPCTLREEFDAKERWHIYRVKIGKQSDPIWGICVGGILHNLRATLDNLTWQGALLHSTPAQLAASRARRTQFPIFLHPSPLAGGGGSASFADAGVKVQLRFINPAHHTLFEQQQPYFGTNGRERDPLWILKEMNDADKHRVIHFTCVGLHAGNVTVSSVEPARAHASGTGPALPNVKAFRFVNLRVFVDGAEICRVQYIDETKKNMKVEVSTEVRFDEACGPGSNLPVLDTIGQMYNRVGSILKSFYALFPT